AGGAGRPPQRGALARPHGGPPRRPGHHGVAAHVAPDSAALVPVAAWFRLGRIPPPPAGFRPLHSARWIPPAGFRPLDSARAATGTGEHPRRDAEKAIGFTMVQDEPADP